MTLRALQDEYTRTAIQLDTMRRQLRASQADRRQLQELEHRLLTLTDEIVTISHQLT